MTKDSETPSPDLEQFVDSDVEAEAEAGVEAEAEEIDQDESEDSADLYMILVRNPLGAPGTVVGGNLHPDRLNRALARGWVEPFDG